MPFETCLTFKAECEDCPATKTVSFYGDETGVSVEESQALVDFMFELEFTHGWECERVSYESHNFYCPRCREKRAQEAA